MVCLISRSNELSNTDAMKYRELPNSSGNALETFRLPHRSGSKERNKKTTGNNRCWEPNWAAETLFFLTSCKTFEKVASAFWGPEICKIHRFGPERTSNHFVAILAIVALRFLSAGIIVSDWSGSNSDLRPFPSRGRSGSISQFPQVQEPSFPNLRSQAEFPKPTFQETNHKRRFPSQISKRAFLNERLRMTCWSASSQAKVTKANVPSESSQAKDHTRKLPKESCQAKVPEANIPSESAQAKHPEWTLPTGSSETNARQRNITSKHYQRLMARKVTSQCSSTEVFKRSSQMKLSLLNDVAKLGLLSNLLMRVGLVGYLLVSFWRRGSQISQSLLSSCSLVCFLN